MTAAASLLLTTVVRAEPLITSITKGGSLTWSNYLPNATYRVEWATAVDGPWNTNPPSWVISSTSHVTTVDIPMFYRVAWLDPPDIRYRTIQEQPDMLWTSHIDLNEDGETDFRIQRIWMSAGDTASEHTTIRAYYTLGTPFSYGDMIGPTTPWEGTNKVFSIATRTSLGPYDYGSWAGATNAYIPLGFLIDDNVHYGWLRKEMIVQQFTIYTNSEPTELFLHSYQIKEGAWHIHPDTPIYAGQLE